LFEPEHQYRHRRLRSLYERRARSTEAAHCAEDRHPQRVSSGSEVVKDAGCRDCGGMGTHELRNESRCSSGSDDDDRSSVVHVVNPQQHDRCNACRESTLYVM